MRLIYIFILTVNIIFLDENFNNDKFDSLKNKSDESFNSVNNNYKIFLNKQKQSFEKHKQETLKRWNDFKHSTNKKYVEYSNNNNSRLVVDFEKGNLVVEVLIDEKQDEEGALKMLSEEIEKAVNIKVDENSFLLENQLKTDHNIVINPSNIKTNVDDLISKQKIEISDNYIANDGEERVTYSVTIPFDDDHLNIRASKYKNIIIKNSKRFNLDPAIVYAIIETESAFNPKAKSHIPAYGLMQLVPETGARDAYKFLYDKDKFLNARYLYNPEKNIELGCAYLYKIRNVYFKDIVDDQKAFMCSVAAYNTGIGNVALTLSNTKDFKKTSSVVNKMNKNKLFKKLCDNLEHEEARNYISKVWDRKDKYTS